MPADMVAGATIITTTKPRRPGRHFYTDKIIMGAKREILIEGRIGDKGEVILIGVGNEDSVTENRSGPKTQHVSLWLRCTGCSELRSTTGNQWNDGNFFCQKCTSRNRRRLRRHKSRTCKVCGTSFTTTRRDASYCSNACRQKAYRGAAAKPSADAPAELAS